MAVDYTTVTEVPGNKVTREQLRGMYTRYRFAADLCEGKEVLEVACGPGIGLGYLAKRTRKVIGGDYTQRLLRIAQSHYREAVNLLSLDAHRLPFKGNIFDAVILYEAIYYLAKPEDFVQECCRILRRNGLIIICSVNKDWSDFNPSPFSMEYFSVSELSALLEQHGFDVECFGSCPAHLSSLRDRIKSVIKRTAIALRLVPKTMKAKEIFKRIFFGELLTLEEEIEDGVVDYVSPVSISSNSPNFQYKVLYVVGRCR